MRQLRSRGPVPATASKGNPSSDTKLFVANERQRYMEKAKFVPAEGQMLNLKNGDDTEGFGICAETFFFLVAQESVNHPRHSLICCTLR